MGFSEQEVMAGQAVYSKKTLKAYDLFVLGLSNRLIWRCPTRRLVDHYNRQLSDNHLDVGVGTGYFLDNGRFPSPQPRLAIMDLNQETLDYTARRIARYRPEVYRRNVLEPIAIDAAGFDSIGINYLLHCIPGDIGAKSVAFDHLKALLKPDGVLFGSTLLQGGVERNWIARRLMAIYNGKGIFANTSDTLDGLTAELNKRFSEVHIEVVGCAALFSARVQDSKN